jgi:hypothetical protein
MLAGIIWIGVEALMSDAGGSKLISGSIMMAPKDTTVVTVV